MKHRLSAVTLFVMMGVMLWCTTVFCPRYSKTAGNATIAWDAAGYYWYLPSVFIYHDLAGQHWADSIIKKYGPGPEDISGFGSRADNGHFVMKYPAGMAVVEAPFFFIAHALAKPLGYARDGFSRPYQVAIQLGALLVAFIGLWLFRRLLLICYSDGVVALCLVILVAGSNYLNYSAIDGSISHSWLFTLYVALLLCTRSFYLRPTAGRAAAVGALCGLAALIRPTDVIACAIPLLWGLEGIRFSAIRGRIAFLRQHIPKLLPAGAIAGCIMAVQPLYWKAVSGQWLVYSYQDQGFSWLHPHILDYTFSYRSGWITYTPVMILAIAGFVPFLRRGVNRVMIVCFSVVAFYLVAAWDIWWYAGSGGRAMIQYYPALFFPLASLLEWMRRRAMWRIAVLPFLLLFTYINIWFTYHAHGGGLYDSDDGMSQAYYWRVIGRWGAPDETRKLKDGKYLYEAPTPSNARLLYADKLHYRGATGEDSMLLLDGTHKLSPDFTFPFQPEGKRWIRAEATFHCAVKEAAPWNMLEFCLGLRKGKENTRETMMRVYRFLENGETKTLSVDLRLPRAADADSLNVHFWNVDSDKKMRIENLRVWAF